MDQAMADKYFSTMSPLANQILKEKSMLLNALDPDINYDELDDVMDNNFLSRGVADTYKSRYIKYNIPPQYPKPKLGSGEKVVINFDNEDWCWQDEHSGPFSWETKSQLETTGVDSEHEGYKRPSTPKLRRISNISNRAARPPSSDQSDVFKSIWKSPFLQADTDSSADILSSLFAKSELLSSQNECSSERNDVVETKSDREEIPPLEPGHVDVGISEKLESNEKTNDFVRDDMIKSFTQTGDPEPINHDSKIDSVPGIEEVSGDVTLEPIASSYLKPSSGREEDSSLSVNLDVDKTSDVLMDQDTLVNEIGTTSNTQESVSDSKQVDMKLSGFDFLDNW